MKRIVIVGATDGIGLALARIYLEHDWQVAVVGRVEERTATVVADLQTEFPSRQILSAVSDVRERAHIEGTFRALVEEMGGLELIVFCAGTYHSDRHMTESSSPHPAPPSTESELDTFDVNLLGAVAFVGAAIRHFLDAGAGHVAVLGSIAGERGRAGNPSYCASKAGVDAYLEGWRARLHGSGIRVTTVKPGFVRTKMLGKGSAPGAISTDDAARRIKKGLDRGRDVFFVPQWWGLVGWVLRALPRPIFKRFAPR